MSSPLASNHKILEIVSGLQNEFKGTSPDVRLQHYCQSQQAFIYNNNLQLQYAIYNIQFKSYNKRKLWTKTFDPRKFTQVKELKPPLSTLRYERVAIAAFLDGCINMSTNISKICNWIRGNGKSHNKNKNNSNSKKEKQ